MKRIIVLVLCLTAVLAALSACGAKEATMDSGGNWESKPEDSGSNLNKTEDTVLAEAERKIIRTYTVSAETTDFESTLSAVERAVGECGGYVESSSVFGHSLTGGNSSSPRRASYTLRIPAEQAEDFLRTAGSLLNITGSTSSVEDVSDSYYSVEARLEELKAERDSLMKILDSLSTKEDYNFWLTVEERLSAIKQEIAVYQRMLMNYDSKVSYSTVTLSFYEVVRYSPSEERGFFRRLGDSFVDGWRDFSEGAQDFAVWLVGATPVLLLLAVIVTVVILIVRRVGKKKKKRTEQNR